MDWKQLAQEMLNAAKEKAGASWSEIKQVAKHEFEVLAQRFVSIGEAYAIGEITKNTSKILYRTARSQIVAVLAMLSTLIAAAATKIVKAALAVVKSAVNSAVGFNLVT